MRPVRILTILVVLAWPWLPAVPSAQSASPLAAAGSIALPHVDGRIDHLAFDPGTGRLFVAALGHGTVEVVDTHGERDIRSLPGFREPQGIAVAPAGGPIGIANGEGTGVDLLDPREYRHLAAVPLGDDADDMREEGGRFYVGYGEGAIAVIDPRGAKLLGTVTLPGHPEAFAVEHTGSRIFVNIPTAGRIAVIDRRAMKVVANWPVVRARSNFPMALDEAGHRLFVGCRDPARVLVYDTRSGRLLDSFAAVGDTDDLFYDASRKRLYVSGGQGYLDVVDAGTDGHYPRIAHIATASGARTSLFVPEQHRLYVAVPHRGRQRAEVRVFDVR